MYTIKSSIIALISRTAHLPAMIPSADRDPCRESLTPFQSANTDVFPLTFERVFKLLTNNNDCEMFVKISDIVLGLLAELHPGTRTVVCFWSH